MPRTGIQIGPLRRNIAAAAIANPVIEKLISFEALSQLLTLGWPVTVVPDAPPPGTVGITTNTIGTIWQIFGNSEYGFGRFEVAGPAALPPQLRKLRESEKLQSAVGSSYERMRLRGLKRCDQHFIAPQ